MRKRSESQSRRQRLDALQDVLLDIAEAPLTTPADRWTALKSFHVIEQSKQLGSAVADLQTIQTGITTLYELISTPDENVDIDELLAEAHSGRRDGA